MSSHQIMSGNNGRQIGPDWEVEVGTQSTTMDGEPGVVLVENGGCPRCAVCGRVVRVRGVGRVGVWCSGCLGGLSTLLDW